MKCNLCPRECNVNRDVEVGFCKIPNTLKVARAALHMWEEPCISGENGSGAIFFSGCPLKCVFCQNKDIAQGKVGKDISVERLSEIMLELQEKKANNINLVTPTHYIYPIIKAIEMARNAGLQIPIVYNTSSYEKVDAIKQLEGIVDVYLPDLKYYSPVYSLKYSSAKDYFGRACEVIEEMYRQVGTPEFFAKTEVHKIGIEPDIMKKGVIVRHLILPGLTEDSKKIVEYLYRTYQDNIFISIMNQYTPLEYVQDIPELNRKITDSEYDEVVDYAIDLGVTNGFIQEGDTASDSFIPDFNYEGV